MQLALPSLHRHYRSTMRSMLAFLLLLAFMQLFALLMPTAKRGISVYLPIHTLMETISIVISMMVFTVGWITAGRRMSGNSTILAAVFFSVGLLDFFHTISYAGMPDFISVNDQQKQLNFWLAARILAALSLLWVAARPWEALKSQATRYLIFISLLVMVSIITWAIVWHQGWFPDTFIPGVGLTPYKKDFEYLIILINLTTATVLWVRMREIQQFNIVLLFGAVCTIAMSEFFFTLYTTMFGSYNVLGHLYKVIAYLLIYRALVLEVIEAPYNLLHESQQKLALLLQASNTGFWNWDLNSNQVYYSPEWKAQLGYLADELSDHYSTWNSLLHPDDSEQVLRQMNEYLASTSRDEYASGFRLCHKDGSYRWILARGIKQYDIHGKLTHLVGLHVDISDLKWTEMEQKRLHHRLDEREEVFLTLANNISQLVWMADAQGAAFWYNQRWFDYTGTTLDEMSGWGWMKVHHPDYVQSVVKKLSHCFKTGEIWEDTFPLRGADGQYRWFLSKAVPIRDQQGALLRWFGTNTDITENKLAEAENCRLAFHAEEKEKRAHELLVANIHHKIVITQLQQIEAAHKNTEKLLLNAMQKLEAKDQSKTRFLAAAGHDLRQPLAAANMFLFALKSTVTTSEQKELVQSINNSMGTFKGLLDALLNVSKLDSNMIKPECAAINVPELIIWLEENFKAMAGEKQLGFKLYFSLKHILFIHSDINLLKSVLMNLVSNAIKFSTKGAILVSARKRGADVLFQVWDTGIGIPVENIKHIFDEFYQVDNPQRDRTMGLGLGLSIVKRTLALLGGNIECRSQSGQGTVFDFCLPIAATSSVIPPQSATIDIQQHLSCDSIAQGKHFVVVEDDLMVAQATTACLEIMGGKVRCFHRAEDALLCADIERTDYFIVDYMLGGTLNGIQFLNQLRQQLGKSVHAVLVTGDTSSNLIQDTSDFAWPVQYKPVNMPALLTSLSGQADRLM